MVGCGGMSGGDACVVRIYKEREREREREREESEFQGGLCH